MKTIRFWDHINAGPVRLSLRDGQRIHWRRFTPDEEGWSVHAREYRRDAEEITATAHFRGKDCDGIITETQDWKLTPKGWQVAGPARCSDQYAAAAGY